MPAPISRQHSKANLKFSCLSHNKQVSHHCDATNFLTVYKNLFTAPVPSTPLNPGRLAYAYLALHLPLGTAGGPRPNCSSQLPAPPLLPGCLSSAALSPKNSLSRFSCKTFLLKLAAAGRRNRNRNCARRDNKATAAAAAASGHATVDTLCQSSLLQQSLLVTVNVTSNVSFSVSVSFSCCSCSCSRTGYHIRSFFCSCSRSCCPFCSSSSCLFCCLPLFAVACSQRIYFARLFLDFGWAN